MLHWLYILEFYVFLLLISLLIYNKELAHLLLLGESFLLFFFLIGLFISSLYNLFFLVGFSFFIIILGGLELALNILLLIL